MGTYCKNKKCVYKFDRYLQAGRDGKNRLVGIQPFSLSVLIKEYEIITAENSKYIIFFSIIVDNMIIQLEI
jgi:hypothetical protein